MAGRRREHGSIRRIGAGKRWQVRVTDPRTGKQVSIGTFATKAEATRALSQVVVDQSRGVWGPPDRARRMTLGEWLDQWLELPGRRPKTRDGYSWAIERVKPLLGRVKLADLSTMGIQAALNELATQLKPSSVKKVSSVLHAALEAAVPEVLGRNPAAGVKVAGGAPTSEMAFLSVDEVDALVAAIDKRYTSLVAVGCWCGLRWGELAGLYWDRVDLLRGTLRVDNTIAPDRTGALIEGPPKTAASHRTIHLPGHVAELLRAHLEATGGNGLVWRAPMGGPLYPENFRRRFFTPAKKAAGVPAHMRVHDMRHTAASLAILAGVHPRQVQGMLGHTSIRVTMDRYGHLFPDDRSTADALDSLALEARRRRSEGEVRALRRRA